MPERTFRELKTGDELLDLIALDEVGKPGIPQYRRPWRTSP